MKNQFLVLGFIALAAPFANAETKVTATSPDGSIRLNVALIDNELKYDVMKNDVQLMAPSKLGLELSGIVLDRFESGFEISRSEENESFDMLHGKRSHIDSRYSTVSLDCSGENSRRLTVEFRIYNDALAFRYIIDDRMNFAVDKDLTEFKVCGFSRSWVQKYKSDYSDYYVSRSKSDVASVTEGFCAPMLIEAVDDNYILLTEAASYATMPASKIMARDAEGSLGLDMVGQAIIESDRFESPWRTMLIGGLADIVESTTIAALNPANRIADTSWIVPGRVAWNWGAEDGDSAPTFEQAKAYIDLAAYMGWEYFLLDDGWDGRIDLKEVVDYAAGKGVGLMIWTHQNRFLNNAGQIRNIFKSWAEQGVKGVKIDFFEDDSQSMLSKYEKILEASAMYKVMVNFHGCTKPSGMERTYPHLMTSEAVLGGEFYMFNTTMTPASHGVNLALTRNVLGPMDYTPVKYGNKRSRVITNTTWAYQTTLPVLFESSLQCVCDCPANITGSIAEPLLRQLPVVWDDIVCTEALPDEYITLARRSGDDWWLATATSKSRTVVPDLSFLNRDMKYSAYIYTEGSHRSDIEFRQINGITCDSEIILELGDDSGATVIFSTESDRLIPLSLKREAEDYNRRGSKTADSGCSGGYYVKDINSKAKSLQFNDLDVEVAGDYLLTVFYLDNADHDAYIQLNGGEKEYHSFKHVSSNMSGNDIALLTIPVKLNAGHNEIIYGNDNGIAPAVDRIVLTTYVKGAEDLSGIGETAVDLSVLPTVSIVNGIATVNSPADGGLTVYNLDGSRIKTYSFEAGTGHIALNLPAGIYIAAANAGSHSVSSKFIVK